ncbi:MAG: NAD-dependent epimerase/dehydratase, partial [uncultured Rubellimicrobium sp.]
VEAGHDLRGFGLPGPLRRPTHGQGGLARPRGRPRPQHRPLRAHVRPCGAGRASGLQHPRRRLGPRRAPGGRCGGQLRGHLRPQGPQLLPGHPCRCLVPRRPYLPGGRGPPPRPHLGHRRRRLVGQRIRPVQGRGRTGRARPHALCRDPAPLRHVRAGGSVLQPLRHHGLARARPAARGRRHAVPARLGGRCRAGRRPRRHRPRLPRHLRTRRARDHDLPRDHGPDAPRHPPPPHDPGPALLARQPHGQGLRPRPDAHGRPPQGADHDGSGGLSPPRQHRGPAGARLRRAGRLPRRHGGDPPRLSLALPPLRAVRRAQGNRPQPAEL